MKAKYRKVEELNEEIKQIERNADYWHDECMKEKKRSARWKEVAKKYKWNLDLITEILTIQEKHEKERSEVS
jgi:uncharacterized protein Yka (UPF0111/DUF47 family)